MLNIRSEQTYNLCWPCVGKTFLIEYLKEVILKSNETEMEIDPSFIPAISVEVPKSGEKVFPWKLLYEDIGKALKEPLMAKKVEDRLVNGKNIVINVTTKSTIAGMRQSVQKALGYTNDLMLNCIGCVGILKQTLQKALIFCLMVNNGKWDTKYLEKALLSKAQVQKILEETVDGEGNIHNSILGTNRLSNNN